MGSLDILFGHLYIAAQDIFFLQGQTQLKDVQSSENSWVAKPYEIMSLFAP